MLYQCDICQEIFLTEESGKAHVASVHPNGSPGPSAAPDKTPAIGPGSATPSPSDLMLWSRDYKLNATGKTHSHLILTVPAAWARAYGLTKGSLLTVSISPDGSLRIVPKEVEINQKEPGPPSSSPRPPASSRSSDLKNAQENEPGNVDVEKVLQKSIHSLTWEDDRWGAWAFAKTQQGTTTPGAEDLVAAIQSSKDGKLYLGGEVFSFSGDGDKFISRKKVPKK